MEHRRLTDAITPTDLALVEQRIIHSVERLKDEVMNAISKETAERLYAERTMKSLIEANEERIKHERNERAEDTVRLEKKLDEYITAQATAKSLWSNRFWQYALGPAMGLMFLAILALTFGLKP